MRIQVDVAGDRAPFQQERHRIDAEAVDPQLQPEARDLRDLVAHRRVRDVQFGLVGVEVVQVPLPGLLIPRPDAVFGVREHDVGLLLFRRLVDPDVEVPVGRRLGGTRLPEPRVLVRCVVHDEVDDHLEAAVPRGSDQRDEPSEGSQPVVHAVVVADVVPVIPVRGGVEGHEPQTTDPDPGQVVDALGQSVDVPDAVVVPVEEGLHVEAVDDGVLPPLIARSRDAHRVSSGRTRSPNTSMNRCCSRPT